MDIQFSFDGQYVEDAPTAAEVAEAYFMFYPSLHKGAASLDLSTEDFTARLINVLFHVPGSKEVLDNTPNANNYGYKYSAHDQKQISSLILSGHSLTQVATILMRTVFGVGWKALTMKPVHDYLKHHQQYGEYSGETLLNQWISAFNPIKKSAKYYLCLPTLNFVFRNLWHLFGDQSEHSRDEAAITELETLGNRILNDEPIGSIKIWAKVEKEKFTLKMVPEILAGETLLENMRDAFGLSWVYGDVRNFDGESDVGKALLKFDVRAGTLVAENQETEQESSTKTLNINQLHNIFGKKFSELNLKQKFQIRRLSFLESNIFDPDLDKQVNRAFGKLQQLLSYSIPVEIVVATTREEAERIAGIAE